MDILGHGIDVIDIGRIRELMARSEDLLFGWFTSRELSALEARGNQACVVGGRIAAKEAVAKALGSGFAGEVSWQDIEIMATDAGAPTVELSGGGAELARSLGLTKLVVSISHSRTVAVASAIAVGSATATPSQGS